MTNKKFTIITSSVLILAIIAGNVIGCSSDEEELDNTIYTDSKSHQIPEVSGWEYKEVSNAADNVEIGSIDNTYVDTGVSVLIDNVDTNIYDIGTYESESRYNNNDGGTEYFYTEAAFAELKETADVTSVCFDYLDIAVQWQPSIFNVPNSIMISFENVDIGTTFQDEAYDILRGLFGEDVASALVYSKNTYAGEDDSYVGVSIDCTTSNGIPCFINRSINFGNEEVGLGESVSFTVYINYAAIENNSEYTQDENYVYDSIYDELTYGLKDVFTDIEINDDIESKEFLKEYLSLGTDNYIQTNIDNYFLKEMAYDSGKVNSRIYAEYTVDNGVHIHDAVTQYMSIDVSGVNGAVDDVMASFNTIVYEDDADNTDKTDEETINELGDKIINSISYLIDVTDDMNITDDLKFDDEVTAYGTSVVKCNNLDCNCNVYTRVFKGESGASYGEYKFAVSSELYRLTHSDSNNSTEE